MKTFVYQRGEPISVDLVINDAGSFSAEALSDLTVQMRLKPASSTNPPPRQVPAVATFTVNFVAASGEEPAYWRGTISAASSAKLSPGHYVTDAMISDEVGVIEVTGFALLKVAESVTPL